MGYVATSIFSAYSGSGYEGIPPHFGNPEPWVSKRTFGLVVFSGISQAKWLNTGGSFCGCSPHPNASALCEVSIEHRQCQCAMCGSFRSGDDLEGVTKLHTTPSSPSAPYFRGHFPGQSTMLRPPHPTGAACSNSRPPPPIQTPKSFRTRLGSRIGTAPPPSPPSPSTAKMPPLRGNLPCLRGPSRLGDNACLFGGLDDRPQRPHAHPTPFARAVPAHRTACPVRCRGVASAHNRLRSAAHPR